MKTVTFSDEMALVDQQKEGDCSIIVKVWLNFWLFTVDKGR